MKSAPWIQGAVMLSLALMGLSFLLDAEGLYSEKAPVYAFLAAGSLITQQVGRVAATSRHRIDWLDNSSLLLAAFYAGCSGWYWLAAEANAAGPAWFLSIVVLIFMAIFGSLGWVAYKLFGNGQASEDEE